MPGLREEAGLSGSVVLRHRRFALIAEREEERPADASAELTRRLLAALLTLGVQHQRLGLFRTRTASPAHALWFSVHRGEDPPPDVRASAAALPRCLLPAERVFVILMSA